MTFDEDLQKTLSVIKERIEKEMPDTGYFCTIAYDFKNTDETIFARAIAIAVQRDINNEGMGYLTLNMLHPTTFVNGSTNLGYGNRERLLAILNDEQFYNKLKDHIKMLSEKMKNVDIDD